MLPSLLGAAPSQLQKISNRSIIMAPTGGRVLGGGRGEEEDVNGSGSKECSTTTVTTKEEGMKAEQQIERVHGDKRVSSRRASEETGQQKEDEQTKKSSESSCSVERSVGASVGSAEREEEERNVSSPLPKEIWWLLVHIYSQISSEKDRKRTSPRRNKMKVHDSTTGGQISKKSCGAWHPSCSSSTSYDSSSTKGEEKVSSNEEPHSPPSGDPGKGDISSSSSLSMRRRCSIALEGEKTFDLASFLSSPCSAVLQRPKHLRGSTTFFRREGEGDHGGGRGENEEESTMSSDLDVNTKKSSDTTEGHQRDSSSLRENVETSINTEKADSATNPAEAGGSARRKDKEEETKATDFSEGGAGTGLGGADGSMVMSSERAEEGQPLTRRRRRLADEKFPSWEEEEEATRRKREVSLEEEAEFVRMCVESGVVVPNNVSVDAALMVRTSNTSK